MILCSMIFVGILIGINNVYGASASVSAGSTNVTVGQSTTITVSVSNVEGWDLRLSSTGGVLGNTANAGAFNSQGSGTAFSTTFVSNTPGTFTVSLAGTVAGADLLPRNASGSVTINVSAPQVTQPPVNNPPANNPDTNNPPAGGGSQAGAGASQGGSAGTTPEQETAPVLSSNGHLASLEIEEGYLFPPFDRTIREYTVYVLNNVTEITITPKVEHLAATYYVSGNTNLEVR